RAVSTTVQFPPQNASLLSQGLQVVAVLQWVFSFLGLAQVCMAVLLSLLVGRAWILAVLYLVWLYRDRDSPRTGGRRSAWVRNWAVWRHFCDYFPISLVKTAELPPNQNYVMGVHPHGIMCAGAFCNFSTEGKDFSLQFPGLGPSPMALAGLFSLPVYHDHLMSTGICSVSHQTLHFISSQPQRGQALIIIIGGGQEFLYSSPGQHCCFLWERKGFVRLVLWHGASLVPVYSFGENDIFKVKVSATSSWSHGLCFSGRGLFSADSWGLLPFAVPITSLVGRPIQVLQCLNPTEEEVDHYHRLYMKAMEQFEEHKESCGVPASTHLTFL
uniref:Acyltransferase n=1 Tax=Loxodonta africana TaxID=9785 RepID=G3SY54_LOXAF